MKPRGNSTKLSPQEYNRIVRTAATRGIRPAAAELGLPKSTVFDAVERSRAAMGARRGPAPVQARAAAAGPATGPAAEAPSGPLDAQERRQLDRCEATIRQGWDTFVAVGLALREIRDRRLYRRDFPRFQDYCRARWRMSPSYAHRQIGGATVAEVLRASGETALCESQLRPLLGLQAGLVLKAWAKAKSLVAGTGRSITAAVVRQALAEVGGPPDQGGGTRRQASTAAAVGAALEWLDKAEDCLAHDQVEQAAEALRQLRQALNGANAKAPGAPEAPAPVSAKPASDDANWRHRGNQNHAPNRARLPAVPEPPTPTLERFVPEGGQSRTRSRPTEKLAHGVREGGHPRTNKDTQANKEDTQPKGQNIHGPRRRAQGARKWLEEATK